MTNCWWKPIEKKHSIQEENRKTTPVALIFSELFGFSQDFEVGSLIVGQ